MVENKLSPWASSTRPRATAQVARDLGPLLVVFTQWPSERDFAGSGNMFLDGVDEACGEGQSVANCWIILQHVLDLLEVHRQPYSNNGERYSLCPGQQKYKSKQWRSIDTYDDDGKKQTYYGFIESIWELDYRVLKVPLLRCKWVRIPRGLKVDKHGMIIVDLNDVGYKDEPFMLAKSFKQILYVKDPSLAKSARPHHVVFVGKLNIVGMENIVDEEDYDQPDEQPPPTTDVELENEETNEEDEEALYVRTDHQEGLLVRVVMVKWQILIPPRPT
uniref:Transposon protein, putative, CACTA, En/Spm sub-class n=1 Tax=Oryza sativa subsp. japonica TaxID=39947 RepID=Q2QPE9_ORYSJ|nr:transposon protein, putative, CACTA, En/Spm sub-class [Oryza sativa Japonica Group]